MGPAVTLEKAVTRCTSVPVSMIRLSRSLSGGGGGSNAATSNSFQEEIHSIHNININNNKSKSDEIFRNNFESTLPTTNRLVVCGSGGNNLIEKNIKRSTNQQILRKDFNDDDDDSNFGVVDNDNSPLSSKVHDDDNKNDGIDDKDDEEYDDKKKNKVVDVVTDNNSNLDEIESVEMRNNVKMEDGKGFKINNISEGGDDLIGDKKKKLLDRIKMMRRKLNHLHKKQVKRNISKYYKQLQQLLYKNNILTTNNLSSIHQNSPQRQNLTIQQDKTKEDDVGDINNHNNDDNDDDDDEVCKFINRQIQAISSKILNSIKDGDDEDDDEATDESSDDGILRKLKSPEERWRHADKLMKRRWEMTCDQICNLQQKITNINKAIKDSKQKSEKYKKKGTYLMELKDQLEEGSARCRPIKLLARRPVSQIALMTPHNIDVINIKPGMDGTSQEALVQTFYNNISWMSEVYHGCLMDWLHLHNINQGNVNNNNNFNNNFKTFTEKSFLSSSDENDDSDEQDEDDDDSGKSNFQEQPIQGRQPLLIRIKKSLLAGLSDNDVLSSITSPSIRSSDHRHEYDNDYDYDDDDYEDYDCCSLAGSTSTAGTFKRSQHRRSSTSKTHTYKTSLSHIQPPTTNNQHHLGSHHHRRKSYPMTTMTQQPPKKLSTSSYDINDVYIPSNMSSCRLEQLTYKEIDVPKWRVLDESFIRVENITGDVCNPKTTTHLKLLRKCNRISAPDDDAKIQTMGEQEMCVGDAMQLEDTRDEVYVQRHLAFEIYEKKQRIPHELPPSANKSVGSNRKRKVTLGSLDNDHCGHDDYQCRRRCGSYEYSADHYGDQRHSTISASSETLDWSSWSRDSNSSPIGREDEGEDDDVVIGGEYYNQLWPSLTSRLGKKNKKRTTSQSTNRNSFNNNWQETNQPISRNLKFMKNLKNNNINSIGSGNDDGDVNCGGGGGGDDDVNNSSIHLLNDNNNNNINNNENNVVTFFSGPHQGGGDDNDDHIRPPYSPSCSTTSAHSPLNFDLIT